MIDGLQSVPFKAGHFCFYEYAMIFVCRQYCFGHRLLCHSLVRMGGFMAAVDWDMLTGFTFLSNIINDIQNERLII